MCRPQRGGSFQLLTDVFTTVRRAVSFGIQGGLNIKKLATLTNNSNKLTMQPHSEQKAPLCWGKEI